MRRCIIQRFKMATGRFMCECLNVVVLSSAIICFHVFVSSAHPMWDKSDVTLKQGENLNVSCAVHDASHADVIRIALTHWGNRSATVVADNANVKNPFKKLGRLKVGFSSRKEGASKTDVVTLSYNGIRGEDAGTLECYSLSNDTVIARLRINVQVPVKSVQILPILPSLDDRRPRRSSDVTLVENIERGLYCLGTVDGSLTSPTLRLSINGRDVTKRFTATHQSKIEDQAVIDDVGRYHAETKLTYLTNKPDPTFNNATITCSAEQTSFPNINATSLIIVQYVPVISCPKREEIGKVGESLMLTCDVRANPAARLTWKSGATLSGSKPLDENSTHVMNRSVSFDQTQISLHINKVTDLHYTSYYLIATNAIGISNVTLTVGKTASKTKPKDEGVYSRAQADTGNLLNAGASSHNGVTSVITWSAVILTIFV